jgi:redox-sensitive bicupin YhaK (pirin superfamily)
VSDPVLEEAPLGFQWPMVDPFLFCAHHLDAYPAANDAMGPAAALSGRALGQDFEGIDGWRMYHGLTVPGFPQHPHRGFETVTYVRRGLIDHADSIGAAARFGRGDVQWMTAGGGVVYSEMFPLLERDAPNPVELFQIWLNLPSEDKLVAPHFAILWDDEIPRVTHSSGRGAIAQITVIAGPLEGATPPPPPPHSWAARPDADVAIWHVTLEPGAEWTMPPARVDDTVRTAYAFSGDAVTFDGHEVPAGTAARLAAGAPVVVTSDDGGEFLLLQGRPIGEPVAQYGPFVMNRRADIAEAIADFQRTGFGHWPWASDDPVHAHDEGRFARHADGRVERR